MIYAQQHLRRWLIEHKCINITKLEREASVPVDTVRHFLKERRPISDANRKSVENVLHAYGYASI